MLSSDKQRKSRWDQDVRSENEKTKTKDKEESKIQGSSSKEKSNEIISIGTKRSLECTSTEKKPSVMSIKLNAKPKDDESLVKKKPVKLASVFNNDSDSEEEMPLECRMKMRNIGRNTITSAGPKSFNKGKNGFVGFQLSMKPKNNMERQHEVDD